MGMLIDLIEALNVEPWVLPTFLGRYVAVFNIWGEKGGVGTPNFQLGAGGRDVRGPQV